MFRILESAFSNPPINEGIRKLNILRKFGFLRAIQQYDNFVNKKVLAFLKNVCYCIATRRCPI